MVEYLPWKLSPFFRQSIEAVPKILSRKFGLPSQGRPTIESTIYYSREAVRRAIEEHGDAANVLPFFGVKMTNIMINPDSSVNPKRLKDDGILLKNDGEMCTFFFGRPVRVEMDIIFFTNDNNEMLDIIQQIMILGSELHANMKIATDIRLPLKLKIDKDGIAIPEMQTDAEVIGKFELQFPLALDTYTGIITEVPSIKTVKLGGGLVAIDQNKLSEGEYSRVERAIATARTGDIDTLEVEDVVIQLNTDIVDTP